MRIRLANNDEHAEVVRQAMNEYEERKRRETEARYQRRLLIFAENRDSIISERAEMWYEKANKIESAKRRIHEREKSFKESVKAKVAIKYEKFTENYHRFQTSRQESARIKAERAEIVEKRSTAAAEKLRMNFEATNLNRQLSMKRKVERIQNKHAKAEEAKENLNCSIDSSSANKLKQLQNKGKADLDRVEQVKRIREGRALTFSGCTKENLVHKVENFNIIRELNMAEKRPVSEKQAESFIKNERHKLQERIKEKQQHTKGNRKMILNTKVMQHHTESSKVQQTKEIVEVQMRRQEKLIEEKLQAKVNVYKEKSARRLGEQKEVEKLTANRMSLQEIINDKS